ncbi:hypothetical protein Plec18167_007278 [Paecilomyces lecythidis]|uniref:C6 zinc finger domain protein n=1 Tax=Paecilomyces lecythidis TaxID=3004212 RepID=A0ABR3X5G8_9EURO
MLPGTTVPHLLNPLCISASTEEKQFLDWFKTYTVTKLPGSFLSEFWSRLLLQTSLSEPAVLHASLALSAVHKVDTAHLRLKDRPVVEQFALRHYLKALNLLKTHFSKRDKQSYHVILIACVVFVALECLRGHIGSARAHINNGLNIIKELNQVPTTKDQSLITVRIPTLADEWIVEMISRLDLQTRLFGQHTGQFFCGKEERGSIPQKFRNFKDAWSNLDYLTIQVLRLSDISRTNKESRPALNPQSLPEQREKILRALKRWNNTWNTSEQALRERIPAIVRQKAVTILRIHHTMTMIMAELCLCTGDEMAFDTQDHRFLELLDLISSISTGLPREEGPLMPEKGPQGSTTRRGSIVDLGTISPLYFIITKCRLRHVRHQAIGLLETYCHRESIWDPVTAALVGRKVIELEERDFYDSFGTPGTETLSSSQNLEACDLIQPRLPESHRIADIEMVLSGNPTQKLFLFGRKHGSQHRSCLADFDLPSPPL